MRKSKTTTKKKADAPLEKEALIIEGEYSNILARLHKKGIDPSRAIALIFLRMGNSLVGKSRNTLTTLLKK